MKIPPILFGLSFALSALSPWLGRAATDPAVPRPLYVTIQAQEPIEFHRYRHGLADGKELILSTLKMSADRQARFADYPGDVVVLGAEEEPPADAPVLRLTWTAEVVTADLLANPGAKPLSLGVVSRSELSEHPDYLEMRHEVDVSGSSDRKRDAAVRMQTKAYLYQALRRAKRLRQD